MSKKDYYQLLNLTNEDKNLNFEDFKKKLKTNFRTLAFKHHPDKGGDETLFKEINEAYEVLSNQESKEKYDRFGHNAPKGGGAGGFNPFDHFNEFFGRAGFNPFSNDFNPPKVRRGEDLNVNLKLTLEEILNGTNKKIKYRRKHSCLTCEGKGGTGEKKCPHCHGTGNLTQVINTPFGQIRNMMQCNHCNGEGNMYEKICTVCNGEGCKDADETVSIDIPAGVQEGMRMSFQGKGNAIRNGTPGDLIIIFLQASHSTFVRNGNDLKLNLSLTYPQLVLGDKVDIPTIDGGKIKVIIPEFSKVGDLLKIQNKGMNEFQNNRRGDMIISLDLIMPKSLSDDERVLITELKKVTEKVALN